MPRRASWSRYALAVASFDDAGLFRAGLRAFHAPEANDAELGTVHSRAYLELLRRYDERGEGLVDGRQTPAYRGMFFRASLAVGGTVLATRLVTSGAIAHAFNPAGGLHHAHPERAAGFCLLNDIAVAVRDLRQRGVRRIAVLDVDAHHGDGTQAIFWEEDVLTVSIHEYGGRFFPGTGTANETGRAEGAGFNMNLPLRRDAGDEGFLASLHTALRQIKEYRPEILLVQFGTDGHRDDPFAHLGLSDDAYLTIAARAHELAHELCGGGLILLGGGGYAPATVARVWNRTLGTIGSFPMLARDG